MLRIFIIVLLIFPGICQGQKLDGKYILQTKSDGAGRTLHFSNGAFNYTLTGHLNTLSVGKGTYKISKKRISLHYQKQTTQDTSSYSIEQQEVNSKSGNVTVRIFDEQQISSPGWIDLLNHKGHVLAKLFNSGKEASNFLISDQQIGSINVSFLGYTSINIPAKRLMGKNSTITVNMRPVHRVFLEQGVVNYQIKEITESSILLYREKEGELLFVKEKL